MVTLVQNISRFTFLISDLIFFFFFCRDLCKSNLVKSLLLLSVRKCKNIHILFRIKVEFTAMMCESTVLKEAQRIESDVSN